MNKKHNVHNYSSKLINIHMKCLCTKSLPKLTNTES